MPKPQAPCKDCADKALLCHSSCERYLQFKEDLDKWKALVKESQQMDLYKLSQIRSRKDREAKDRKNKGRRKIYKS